MLRKDRQTEEARAANGMKGLHKLHVRSLKLQATGIQTLDPALKMYELCSTTHIPARAAGREGQGLTPEEEAEAEAEAAEPLALSQPSCPEEDADPDALAPPADPLAEEEEEEPLPPPEEDPEALLELEPSADADPEALEPPPGPEDVEEPEELAPEDAYPDAELAPVPPLPVSVVPPHRCRYERGCGMKLTCMARDATKRVVVGVTVQKRGSW